MLGTLPRDYSFIAPVYDQVFHKPLSEGHKKMGDLLKKCKRIPGVKVLDVGVGSGLMFDYLPVGIDYHGIDINKKMLSIAHEKARKYRRKRIAITMMDAHKLAMKASTYNLVMASSVLSAVENPHLVLKEMIRVTKKGGQIAVILNLRQDSYRSKFIKAFDPITTKLFGFRTDISSEMFDEFPELKLIESEQVNNFLGCPLSTYLLFVKK
jgi:ubiquinone/menaquinone biosynthesis C-methylase UbiE